MLEPEIVNKNSAYAVVPTYGAFASGRGAASSTLTVPAVRVILVFQNSFVDVQTGVRHAAESSIEAH